MLAVNIEPSTQQSTNGIRAVNLRTDLARLADLIELVFADSMDESGRSAIREMRYLSRMGVGLGLIGKLNQLALGISLGYVWEEDGELIGNVSIYPANFPSEMGSTWIIANVAVHPDFRRRGIAEGLMEASMKTIRQQGGDHLILQTNYQNEGAIRLYEKLGFVRERCWVTWWRARSLALPTEPEPFYITRPRVSEWKAEYELAQWFYPQAKGGMGWLRPLHQRLFQRSFFHRVREWVTMNGLERLVIRSEDKSHLLGAIWIDRSITLTSTRLILMVHPSEQAREIASALLHHALRRYRTSPILIEYPNDEEVITELLREYRFRSDRKVWHMRWDVR